MAVHYLPMRNFTPNQPREEGSKRTPSLQELFDIPILVGKVLPIQCSTNYKTSMSRASISAANTEIGGEDMYIKNA